MSSYCNCDSFVLLYIDCKSKKIQVPLVLVFYLEFRYLFSFLFVISHFIHAHIVVFLQISVEYFSTLKYFIHCYNFRIHIENNVLYNRIFYSFSYTFFLLRQAIYTFSNLFVNIFYAVRNIYRRSQGYSYSTVFKSIRPAVSLVYEKNTLFSLVSCSKMKNQLVLVFGNIKDS